MKNSPISPSIIGSSCHSARLRRRGGLLLAVVVSAAAVLGLGVSPVAVASAAPCPNGELRVLQRSELLPECRAYELVTPPYKEGNVPRPFAVSEDGSRVVVSSFGAFDSIEGDPFSGAVEGGAYLLSRTLSGWVTVPIEPPESVYQPIVYLWDVSSDFSRSLWALATHARPQGDVSFYLRESDGSFVEVGSPTPGMDAENVGAYNYLGASADLSHVLFEVGPGSLYEYEYVGVGGSVPSPVGVSGGVGSTELVSVCGARLGSGRGNDLWGLSIMRCRPVARGSSSRLRGVERSRWWKSCW